MNIKEHLSKLDEVMKENRLLKFAMLTVGIAAVVSSVAMCKAIYNQKTVLVPPSVNTQMWVSGNKASVEYVKEFGRYISSLAFSYHPETVRKQFRELLAMYAPEEFENAQKTFYALANQIEYARVASTFYIIEMKIISNDYLEISGYKTSYFPDRQTQEVRASYFVKYRINDGKFQILSVLDKEAYFRKEGGIKDEGAQNANKKQIEPAKDTVNVETGKK